jgi:hypothetical protein
LLDELGGAEAGMVGGFTKFLQPVLMHSSLLGIIGHTLQIALILYFFDDLVDIALDVHTHTPYFL